LQACTCCLQAVSQRAIGCQPTQLLTRSTAQVLLLLLLLLLLMFLLSSGAAEGEAPRP
jgi:hypothetical protein